MEKLRTECSAEALNKQNPYCKAQTWPGGRTLATFLYPHRIATASCQAASAAEGEHGQLQPLAGCEIKKNSFCKL